MKLFTGWIVSAGLVLTAATAHAQVSAPNGIAGTGYSTVSDIEGPYAAMPPEAPPPRYGGPILLPPREVYVILRKSGFSPLGIPHQRGFVYTIAVIDRGGDDGRLVIDARNGRILRFMPADMMGDNFNGDMSYGPAGRLPPPSEVRGGLRPPASIPHVASRTVPVPKASPLAAKPAAEPAEQSASVVQPKPADPQPTPSAAAPTVGQVKPAAPPILPTQAMPKVQGLD